MDLLSFVCLLRSCITSPFNRIVRQCLKVRHLIRPRCAGLVEAVSLDSKGGEVLQLQSHCVEERELSEDLGDCLQRRSLQFASQQAAPRLAAATPDTADPQV